ncbi:MAG: bifunctional methylenetetrahydrofolate dehydrogenase/methenyltetrahydrofolate cyclohydrolase FolD [Burkholderiales bacterium]
MKHKILSGEQLAGQILDRITTQVAQLGSSRKPALAVVLVGNDPASQVYVGRKKTACAKVGIKSLDFTLPEDTTQEALLELIEQLNLDPTVDGILVQLPLPKHLNNKLVIDKILPNKDVDGFHRYNIGSLAINDPQICSCTPHGIMYMLDSLQLDYAGKHVVIIGASNIVGRPMALELLNRGATVTVCNSKTKNLPELSNQADILVVAVGKPKLVKASWVKPDSIVIDVGTTLLDNGKLCGDVDFEEVIPKVSYITPVPGGVGPMTIAMLINNTLHCYYLNNQSKSL